MLLWCMMRVTICSSLNNHPRTSRKWRKQSTLGTDNVFSRRVSSSSRQVFGQVFSHTQNLIHTSKTLMSLLMFCLSLIHVHSPNLHQTAWKYEASLSGGRGSVCWGAASCIPDQWEHSGEPHFENRRGNNKLGGVTITALRQDILKMLFFLLLLFMKGKKWFGDDGRIMALPDPIKESSTRPPLFHMEEDLDPALQTVYRKVRMCCCL